MRPVNKYQVFIQDFEKLQGTRKLFMFILFDDRPTHEKMGDFVHKHFRWLDSLAGSANMYGFAFIDDQTSSSRNPSLRVATHFGIKPNQLPGIILFTMLPKKNAVNKGVYLPVKAELFSQDVRAVEDVFVSLFTACQNALAKTDDQEQLMAELQKEISGITRKQQLQPIYHYLGERLETLTKLPDKIIETVADAFGENLAKRIIP